MHVYLPLWKVTASGMLESSFLFNSDLELLLSSFRFILFLDAAPLQYIPYRFTLGIRLQT